MPGPTFTSDSTVFFNVRVLDQRFFHIVAPGATSYTITGSLPSGLTFTDLGTGIATIAGTVSAESVVILTITATGSGGPTNQALTVYATNGYVGNPDPPAANFIFCRSANFNNIFYSSGGVAPSTITLNFFNSQTGGSPTSLEQGPNPRHVASAGHVDWCHDDGVCPGGGH